MNLTGKAFNLNSIIDYQEGSIVSKEILRKETGNITIFAFDAEQSLSEHTAPFDATVYIIEGLAEIRIGDNNHLLSAGEMIIMPANIPHAVFAKDRFKMMLIMIRK